MEAPASTAATDTRDDAAAGCAGLALIGGSACGECRRLLNRLVAAGAARLASPLDIADLRRAVVRAEGDSSVGSCPAPPPPLPPPPSPPPGDDEAVAE
eukprot:11912797-Alexandrium_andersonii.AAC.1